MSRSILAAAAALTLAGCLVTMAAPSATASTPTPASAPDTPVPGLVPLPVQVTEQSGPDFVVTPGARIVARGEAAAVGRLLATTLRTSTGYALPVVSAHPKPTDLQLVIDAGADYGQVAGNPEAYTLSSGRSGLRISGATRHGLFNGTQTLRQLLPAFAGSPVRVHQTWSVPAVKVLDAPRFGYRGIMVDVARSFQTVDEVKQIIDAAATAKLSVLHIHLADDQGWRIQITNDGRAAGDDIDYTALTRESGGTAVTSNAYQAKDGHTGYYTQAQFRDLVAYAAEREIEVVPEVDIPGHTNAALHAIPQLNTAGSSHTGTAAEPVAPVNSTIDVGYSYLDPYAEVSYTFVQHVFAQLAEMTPGDYLHIGGDESHAMTARYGHQGYVDFEKRAVDIVHDLGKKTLGWNEYSETTLSPGDGVQYWAGSTDFAKRAITEDGAKLLVSPGNKSYLDMKYNPKTPIGLSWACSGSCDFPDYYAWSPENVVPGVGDADILGTEAPLWSETVRGVSDAEFMMFPRALAHGEVGWTQESLRDGADFARRVADVGTRLNTAGINFYDGPHAAWSTAVTGTDAVVRRGSSATVAAGLLAAPGTKTDGSTVAVDAVDDADGLGGSALTGSLGATVRFGDGTAGVPATFTTTTPRDGLHAAGVYRISASHRYARPGTYHGTVTTSDGRTARFTVRVR
ncbi:family 20 glycosylhydrolase [Nocardioides sp. NPDC047086]|uniref:family 20 glycosylhydrolase n=1 Tax=Nocardioides sp. NPDC047086 TaxID=3154810 RepID=UPI0033E93AF0